MCEVMRAPFCAIGSLAIWTMISCPSRRRSVIVGWRSRRPRPFSRRPPRSPCGRSPPRSRSLRSPPPAAARELAARRARRDVRLRVFAVRLPARVSAARLPAALRAALRRRSLLALGGGFLRRRLRRAGLGRALLRRCALFRRRPFGPCRRLLRALLRRGLRRRGPAAFLRRDRRVGRPDRRLDRALVAHALELSGARERVFGLDLLDEPRDRRGNFGLD